MLDFVRVIKPALLGNLGEIQIYFIVKNIKTFPIF